MKTWITSDQHFHHANILNFTDSEGNLIRPGFDDVHDMNEYMITRWNEAVDPGDKVYNIGDIVMKGAAWAFEDIIPHLNGEIVLIKGNHDKAKLHVYAKYFKDVRSEIHMKTFKGNMVIFTHRPILLPDLGPSLPYYVFNVHGHIHQNEIEDKRYYNVCVEKHDYRPVHWDDISILMDKRAESFDKEEATNYQT